MCLLALEHSANTGVLCVPRFGSRSGPARLWEPRFLLALCPRHTHLELRRTHPCRRPGMWPWNVFGVIKCCRLNQTSWKVLSYSSQWCIMSKCNSSNSPDRCQLYKSQWLILFTKSLSYHLLLKGEHSDLYSGREGFMWSQTEGYGEVRSYVSPTDNPIW